MHADEMSIGLRFVLAALATWRIAFLLVREDGPWGSMANLRRIGRTGLAGHMLACVKCAGMWVSIPFAFFVLDNLAEFVVVWLALSGVTALIDEWTRSPLEWQETKSDELLRTNSDVTDD